MINDSSLYKFFYHWWKNIDKSIFFLITFLFAIGLFFSLVSTSLIASDKLDTNSYFFFFKHLIYIGIGISIIFVFSSLSTEQLFKYSIILFFISLTSLFLVPIIGVEVKGSKRWIDLFFLPRFQPIEILKPFLIIIFATILCSKRDFQSLFKIFSVNLHCFFSFFTFNYSARYRSNAVSGFFLGCFNFYFRNKYFFSSRFFFICINFFNLLDHLCS